jgi:hypothetical protein
VAAVVRAAGLRVAADVPGGADVVRVTGVRRSVRPGDVPLGVVAPPVRRASGGGAMPGRVPAVMGRGVVRTVAAAVRGDGVTPGPVRGRVAHDVSAGGAMRDRRDGVAAVIGRGLGRRGRRAFGDAAVLSGVFAGAVFRRWRADLGLGGAGERADGADDEQKTDHDASWDANRSVHLNDP